MKTIYKTSFLFLLITMLSINYVSASSNLTYTTNYKNSTYECIESIQNNITITDCHGEISVIPYNQDVSIILQVIQTFCLIIITIYLLSKIIIKWWNMATLYEIIVTYVGDPTTISDIPSLIVYISACALFVLLMFTIPYILIVIGQLLSKTR